MYFVCSDRFGLQQGEEGDYDCRKCLKAQTTVTGWSGVLAKAVREESILLSVRKTAAAMH